MLFYKIKAGALQLTTMIAVVIALLLVAFILLVHTHKRFALQTDFVIETIQNSDKGIYYALANNLPINDSTLIKLEDESYKSLKVHTEFWGVFQKVNSVSKVKTYNYQKTAFIGSKQEGNNRTALYLQDNNKPLVLVGNTSIQGTAYVPKQGVKPGTIAGQSFYGGSLINGSQRVASKLPKFQTEAISYLKSIDEIRTNLNPNQYLELESGRTFTNSFSKPLQYIFNTSVINLSHVQITGHIIIQSQSKISVNASAELKDVLLIAPEIEIKQGVKGNFQAFATKHILVEEDVTLEYPSTLVVNTKSLFGESTTQEDAPNKIVVNKNSTVKGALVFLGKTQSNNYKPQIVLEENTRVFGEVYCEQNIELKGEVYGSVYANNFIANQSGSVYQNHLYNTEIKIDMLPKEYVGLPLKNSKKGIVKWLY